MLHLTGHHSALKLFGKDLNGGIKTTWQCGKAKTTQAPGTDHRREWIILWNFNNFTLITSIYFNLPGNKQLLSHPPPNPSHREGSLRGLVDGCGNHAHQHDVEDGGIQLQAALDGHQHHPSHSLHCHHGHGTWGDTTLSWGSCRNNPNTPKTHPCSCQGCRVPCLPPALPLLFLTKPPLQAPRNHWAFFQQCLQNWEHLLVLSVFCAIRWWEDTIFHLVWLIKIRKSPKQSFPFLKAGPFRIRAVAL